MSPSLDRIIAETATMLRDCNNYEDDIDDYKPDAALALAAGLSALADEVESRDVGIVTTNALRRIAGELEVYR